MQYKVALSYAGEDRRFVEYVASILKLFLGTDSVFHYTTGSVQTNINAFFRFINGSLNAARVGNARDVVRTVCFVRQVGGGHRIVVGQQTELLDRESTSTPTSGAGLSTWQGVTNSRNAQNLDLATVAVTLPLHGMTNKSLKAWSITFDLNCFGQRVIGYEAVSDMDRSCAELVAEFVLRDILGMRPQTHSCKAFTYEKNTITFYTTLAALLRKTPYARFADKQREEYDRLFNAGVPMVWPSVRLRTDLAFRPNVLVNRGTIGAARAGQSSLLPGQLRPDMEFAERVVVSSALSEHHHCVELDATPDACLIRSNLCFPEAGPRARVIEKHSQEGLKVGIVVCGGIAPGINAVIDGIVRRHEDYDQDAKVFGFKYGLRALSQVATNVPAFRPLLSATRDGANVLKTAEHVSNGGSMLGTFRLERLDDPGNKHLLDHILSNIQGLDILYMIGGDGTMKAANLLAHYAREKRLGVSIVGIPKTTDNDILWVWQSFGFATAVEKARDIINCLSTEVKSNPRICVLQLFGSVSGFVVSHAVLSSSSRQCDAALIPEAHFTVKALAAHLMRNFRDTEGRIDSTQLPFGMIVMAETAIPDDAEDYMRDAKLTEHEVRALDEYRNQDSYFDGQTSDDLRSASLKLVVSGLDKELGSTFDKVRIFTNEPRHILRATNPSFADIIMGQRLGALAVDNAMAGYSDFMVSQWLTEYVLVPLRLVSLGRKRIPDSGIFWKSVLAKTEQGELSSRKQTLVPSNTGAHRRRNVRRQSARGEAARGD
jgi:6-phosphofructokinase 1